MENGSQAKGEQVTPDFRREIIIEQLVERLLRRATKAVTTKQVLDVVRLSYSSASLEDVEIALANVELRGFAEHVTYWMPLNPMKE